MVDRNLARRQLTTHSSVTLQYHVRKLYTELGRNNESLGGQKHGEVYKDLGRLSKSIQPLDKVDTLDEIAQRANTSRMTASKVIYINEHLDTTTDEGKKTKQQLDWGDVSIDAVHSEIRAEVKKQELNQKIEAGKIYGKGMDDSFVPPDTKLSEDELIGGDKGRAVRYDNVLALSKSIQGQNELGKVDTLGEIAEHTNISRATAAKIVLFDGYLCLILC